MFILEDNIRKSTMLAERQKNISNIEPTKLVDGAMKRNHEWTT